MNERQQAHFLWDWSKKRQGGPIRFMLYAAGIGAVGGIAFASIMLWAMTLNGASFSINEDEMGGFLVLIARALGPTGFLFFLSVPAFALLGVFLSHGLWGMQEGMYQSLMQSGAVPPASKPQLHWKDNAGKWAVVGVFVLLAIWLLYMLHWEITRGAL